MNEPILIMAMPRSGSSMIAGIFAAHGVWVGNNKAGGRNPKGSFENTALRNLVMMLYDGKGLVERGETAHSIQTFRMLVESAIEADGYKGGPWLWKGSAMYWPAWHQFEPKWIVCRRELDAVLRSSLDPPYVYGRLLADAVRRIIERHEAQLNVLVGKGALEVDTAAVVSGDYTTIKAAIEDCGLAFDEDATRAFVDPTQWHYR